MFTHSAWRCIKHDLHLIILLDFSSAHSWLTSYGQEFIMVGEEPPQCLRFVLNGWRKIPCIASVEQIVRLPFLPMGLPCLLTVTRQCAWLHSRDNALCREILLPILNISWKLRGILYRFCKCCLGRFICVEMCRQSGESVSFAVLRISLSLSDTGIFENSRPLETVLVVKWMKLLKFHVD
jgi:hypothetical protein